MEFNELKKEALAYVKYREVSAFVAVGSVAAALLTSKGNVYVGISLDTACSMGFCAEHAAVAEMLKHQEVELVKIIAVTEDGEVVPPCGRCRELITQLSPSNYQTQVRVTNETTLTMAELLPYDWKPTVNPNWSNKK